VRPAWRDAATFASSHRGGPNVLYVVWDDASIAAWDAFGGLVEMPNMKRLAARGLRYSQWHTPALSALTRGCLLTGRDGGPGSTPGPAARDRPGRGAAIPPDAPTLAEILAGHGCRTYCVGKWQLGPSEAFGMAGSRRAWPLRRGFDRYYGFLGSQTSHWYPDLVYDDQYVDPPYSPADGYHLSRDLADTAVEFLRDAAQAAPGRAWLCYLSFGAADIPPSAPRDWADRYRGRFRMGYDRYREIVLASMKRLGVVPGSTELAAVDQYQAGAPWSAARVPRPWRSLTEEQRQLCNRDCAGVHPAQPDQDQAPWPEHGISMRYTFTAPDAASARRVQRYEAPGARAIYADGWKAIAGPASPATMTGAAAGWQLYDLAADRAETRDLAARYPAKAAELASLWEAAPGRAASLRPVGRVAGLGPVGRAALGRQHRADEPHDRDEEADQAEHPVALTEGHNGHRQQQDQVDNTQANREEHVRW